MSIENEEEEICFFWKIERQLFNSENKFIEFKDNGKFGKFGFSCNTK
jgi:hypothetical protein